jgi:GNAT superfamily N-acetyltransferase
VPTVRPATESDLPGVGLDLAAAFADDPIWQWLCPSPRSWTPRASTYFRRDARARLRSRESVLVPAGGGAAALWAPPDRWRSTASDLAHDVVPALRLFRHRTVRATRLLATIERRHPTEPHWYLAVLGTHPDRQGQGLGSSLITPITDRCDETGLGAYLESSKEANVPFYRRHGFEVVDSVALGTGPPMWLMWREPQAPT